MAAKGDQADFRKGDIPIYSGFRLQNAGEEKMNVRARKGPPKLYVSTVNYGKLQQKLDIYLKRINHHRTDGTSTRLAHRTCRQQQKRSYYMLTKITQQEVINGIRASSIGNSEKVLLKFFIKGDGTSVARHIFLTQGLQEHLQSCLEGVHIRNRLKRSLFYLIDQCPVIYESRSLDHVDMVVCCDYYPSLVNEYVGTLSRCHQNEHIFTIDKVDVLRPLTSELVFTLAENSSEETQGDMDPCYQCLSSFQTPSWRLLTFHDRSALKLNLHCHIVLQHHRIREDQQSYFVASTCRLDVLMEYLEDVDLEGENEIHFQYEAYHYKHLVYMNIYFKNLNN